MKTPAAPIPQLGERGLDRLILRAAHNHGESTFIEFPHLGVSFTCAEMHSNALRLAGGMREIGLQPGDRLAIMLGNRPEFVQSWFASVLGGTIDVAVNHGLRDDLLAHQLRASSIRAIVCDADSYDAVRKISHEVPSLESIIMVGSTDRDGPLPLHSFAQLQECEPIEAQARNPKETVTVRYTSGTTGPAKAVAMTHSRITVISSHFVWLMGYRSDDRLYVCFPLHHGLASTLGVISTLLSGGTLVIDEKFSASRFWERIRDTNATLGHLIHPLVTLILAQDPQPDDGANHRCRHLWGGPYSDAFEERFKTRMVFFYGQSEGNAIAFVPPGERVREGSAGLVSELFDVQIVDEDDYPVPIGEVGQIVWRPLEPHLMTPGYLGAPEATVNAWQNLWHHSGDLGRMDEDGYLSVIGRTGDQIRRKGVNIAAEDIEAVANAHPAVMDSAAVAVPSALGESEIKLAVARRDAGFDVDDFVEFLKSQLPSDMWPRYIDVLEDLPRATTSKPSKARIRELGIGPDTIDLEAHRKSLR
jgi:crotonobetaine/carnitine-CoA ligase